MIALSFSEARSRSSKRFDSCCCDGTAEPRFGIVLRNGKHSRKNPQDLRDTGALTVFSTESRILYRVHDEPLE